MYVRELDLFVTAMLLEDTPAVLSLGKLCEDHGYYLPLEQWSKTTTHQRWQTDRMQHGELRTIRCSSFIDRLLKLSYTYISNIIIAGSPSSSRAFRGYGGDPLRDLPEWLEQLTENLVDESVPEHRDALASSSREAASEPRGKVVSGTHSIYTHFPKDRSCDICLRTKMTSAP